MTRRVFLAVLLAVAGGGLADLPAAAEPTTRTVERSEPDVSDAAVRDAMARGVDYLVRAQNPDGSWGSTAPTLTVDIYAPGRGAYDAYQVASSALALAGLIDAPLDRPGQAAAVRRGADWLLANHAAKRATPDVIYNVWAHAYALEAFGRLLENEEDAARRARLLEAAREAVALLERYEYVDGGWGYYDFSVGSQHPSHGHANSFTTATVLVGLHRAAAQGVPVSPRLARRAVQLIRASRLPGGAYAYSFRMDYRVPRGVDNPKGSLARTPACLEALAAWGDPLPEERFVRALDALERDGHFLRIARKYPVPHETWYQNSGYFCFYGYYYASALLERVGAPARERHRRRIAAHLVPLQEEDGSFWDYQLYGYHKPYGTGYVLTTLARCLAAAR